MFCSLNRTRLAFGWSQGKTLEPNLSCSAETTRRLTSMQAGWHIPHGLSTLYNSLPRRKILSHMKPSRLIWIALALLPLLIVLSCSTPANRRLLRTSTRKTSASEAAQVPTWSRQDLNFFLHGSMSTEVVPEAVLKSFIRIYPDLFPTADLSHFGLIPDPAFGWPVGFSRRPVPSLGGLFSVGINCAACHCAELKANDAAPVRVLGMTSHFDAEAYFGAVTVATFRTADPKNMRQFLAAYLSVSDPSGGQPAQELFASEWKKQEQVIISAMTADPSGSKGAGPGGLQKLSSADVRVNAQLLAASADLAKWSGDMLKLFHNMRASLHIPDAPPDKLPPPSGPGRNDAFGLLSAVLFGAPQPYAPVKYGLVWNLDQRHWVHWDGNTQTPLGRNLLAALGLGAPLIGKEGHLNFNLVKRQTDLTEHIRPPRFPFPIDDDLAKRGLAHYKAECASCHGGPEGERRLYTTAEIGTEPQRAELFTSIQADKFNRFLAELETPGYQASAQPGIRSTQKYWAASLGGVWARSPYLHNGSVRTMQDLLTPSTARAKTFHRGSRLYDPAILGFTDDGPYVLDTTTPGNSNAGHEFGARLSATQKQELLEYLKTL